MSKPTTKQQSREPEYMDVYNNSNAPVVMYVVPPNGCNALPVHIVPGNNKVLTTQWKESMARPGFSLYTKERVEIQKVLGTGNTLQRKKQKFPQILFPNERRNDDDEIEELDRQIAEARAEKAS